jgi:hypothetical protein
MFLRNPVRITGLESHLAAVCPFVKKAVNMLSILLFTADMVPFVFHKFRKIFMSEPSRLK